MGQTASFLMQIMTEHLNSRPNPSKSNMSNYTEGTKGLFGFAVSITHNFVSITHNSKIVGPNDEKSVWFLFSLFNSLIFE